MTHHFSGNFPSCQYLELTLDDIFMNVTYLLQFSIHLVALEKAMSRKLLFSDNWCIFVLWLQTMLKLLIFSFWSTGAQNQISDSSFTILEVECNTHVV